MSTAKYCTNCGTKHVVGLTPVKFCSSCGNPFDPSAIIAGQKAAAQRAAVQNNPVPTQDVNEQPQTNEEGIPQISANDFVISGTQQRKLTVADLKDNATVGASREANATPLTKEEMRRRMEATFARERAAVSDGLPPQE
jgi:hypothetical protein